MGVLRNASGEILRRQEILDFLMKKLMFFSTQKWFAFYCSLTDLDETWIKRIVTVVSKMGLSGLAVSCLCLELWSPAHDF